MILHDSYGLLRCPSGKESAFKQERRVQSQVGKIPWSRKWQPVAARKPVLTPCWKLFLWLAFHCLYYYSSYTMACLEVPASLLDCKLKFSSWRQFVPDHLWIQEINTSLPKAGHSLGDVLEDWRPFHFTSPSASPSLFCLLTLVPLCFFLSDL